MTFPQELATPFGRWRVNKMDVALAAFSLLLALAPQTAVAPDDVGTQEQTLMPITKHVEARFNPNRAPINGSWVGGMQGQDVRLGEVSWSVENSTFEGKPCKLFQAKSKWQFQVPGRNKKLILNPNIYEFAWLSPDGRLLRSQTSYAGIGQPVQVDAIYHADSIDITKTEGMNTSQSTLYPNFSMDLFAKLFDPIMKDGLILAQEREIAFIHPITATPVIVKATVKGRFQGKLYFRQYEGYKIETVSPDGNAIASSMVSRHGQILQIDLPDHQDAVAYAQVSHEEENNWGKFRSTDWDIPASVSQPKRSRYHTMGLPILLLNPSPIILPVPYAMAL